MERSVHDEAADEDGAMLRTRGPCFRAALGRSTERGPARARQAADGAEQPAGPWAMVLSSASPPARL